MKWKLASNGDKRIVEKFLILPRKIEREIRWLERVKIRQYYASYYGRWFDDCFID